MCLVTIIEIVITPIQEILLEFVSEKGWSDTSARSLTLVQLSIKEIYSNMKIVA